MQRRTGSHQPIDIHLKDQKYFNYRGKTKNGLPHGEGSATLTTGLTYTGDFNNGIIDGFGTLKYSDGKVYKGHFKRGKRHGRGRMIFPNGKERNQIYDYGKLKSNGSISDTAEFRDNYLKEVWPVTIESTYASREEVLHHTRNFNQNERRRRKRRGSIGYEYKGQIQLLSGKDKAMNEFINKQKGSNYFRTDRENGQGFGNCGMNRAGIFYGARR